MMESNFLDILWQNLIKGKEWEWWVYGYKWESARGQSDRNPELQSIKKNQFTLLSSDLRLLFSLFHSQQEISIEVVRSDACVHN